jgi:hypothetical protein
VSTNSKKLKRIEAWEAVAPSGYYVLMYEAQTAKGYMTGSFKGRRVAHLIEAPKRKRGKG